MFNLNEKYSDMVRELMRATHEDFSFLYEKDMAIEQAVKLCMFSMFQHQLTKRNCMYHVHSLWMLMNIEFMEQDGVPIEAITSAHKMWSVNKTSYDVSAKWFFEITNENKEVYKLN